MWIYCKQSQIASRYVRPSHVRQKSYMHILNSRYLDALGCRRDSLACLLLAIHVHLCQLLGRICTLCWL